MAQSLGPSDFVSLQDIAELQKWLRTPDGATRSELPPHNPVWGTLPAATPATPTEWLDAPAFMEEVTWKSAAAPKPGVVTAFGSEARQLAHLEGVWADVQQLRRQYSVKGEWCNVWRGGGPSTQRHHLVVAGGEIYWGITRNFILQWQDDDSVLWCSSWDGTRKFAWRRVRGGEVAHSHAVAGWKNVWDQPAQAGSWSEGEPAWSAPSAWWTSGQGYGAGSSVAAEREPSVTYTWQGEAWDCIGSRAWNEGWDDVWGSHWNGDGSGRLAAWWQDWQDALPIPYGSKDGDSSGIW